MRNSPVCVCVCVSQAVWVDREAVGGFKLSPPRWYDTWPSSNDAFSLTRGPRLVWRADPAIVSSLCTVLSAAICILPENLIWPGVQRGKRKGSRGQTPYSLWSRGAESWRCVSRTGVSSWVSLTWRCYKQIQALIHWVQIYTLVKTDYPWCIALPQTPLLGLKSEVSMWNHKVTCCHMLYLWAYW